MTARVSGNLVQSSVQKALQKNDSLRADAARRVLSTLGELKGPALKLGQTLSLGANHLPKEVRGVVSQLFSQAPAVEFAKIVQVMVDEFGTHPRELFQSIDEEPLAAASLGQVHRARLKTGEQVAIKIQYPGVADAMADDLKNAALLVKTLGLGSNLFDGKTYFQELQTELEHELDYARERTLLEEFRVYLNRWDDLVVPKAFAELCTHRVLTLEHFDGPTLHEFVNQAPVPKDIAFRVGDQLTRAIYGPFLLHRAIHADTHPGNFIVLPDGRLGILDFGAVKHFSEPFWRCFRDALQMGLDNHPADLLSALRQGGFTVTLSADRAEDLLREIAQIVGRPLRCPYDFGQDRIVEDLKALGTRRATDFLRVRPPAEGLMFFRSVAGLTHNLRALKSNGDWRPFFRQMLSET